MFLFLSYSIPARKTINVSRGTIKKTIQKVPVEIELLVSALLLDRLKKRLATVPAPHPRTSLEVTINTIKIFWVDRRAAKGHKG